MHWPTSSALADASCSVKAEISCCKVEGRQMGHLVHRRVVISALRGCRGGVAGMGFAGVAEPAAAASVDRRICLRGSRRSSLAGKSRSARQPRSFSPRQNWLRPMCSIASRTAGRPCSSIRSSNERRRDCVTALGTERPDRRAFRKRGDDLVDGRGVTTGFAPAVIEVPAARRMAGGA